MSNGIFRYDLSEIVTRKVPGKYGFVVQRNTKRHTHRRAPAPMSSLRQPFDSTLFNFNNIKTGEVSILNKTNTLNLFSLYRFYLHFAGRKVSQVGHRGRRVGH